MSFTIEVLEEAFCPGVDRAIRMTEKTLGESEEPVYSVGPLIHNPQVVAKLSSEGLMVLEMEKELPRLDGARVIVRSHGIDTATRGKLEERGALLVDATCPTVERAQEAARELGRQGYAVLVIGSADHPEVRSIVGRAGVPVTVIVGVEAARSWVEGPGRAEKKVGVVCQTTIRRSLLADIVEILESGPAALEIRDTICESVARRRRQAVAIAGRVDLMIVVGGRESSNTAKLAEACSSAGTATRHVEDPSEIEAGWLEGVRSVGVAGGASTPEWLIEYTVKRLEEISDA